MNSDQLARDLLDWNRRHLLHDAPLTETLRVTGKGGKTRLVGAFIEDAITLAPQLTATLGLRYENWRASGGFLTNGGTILGTSRDKPHRMPIGGKVLDMTDAVVATYHRHHLDAVQELRHDLEQVRQGCLVVEALLAVVAEESLDLGRVRLVAIGRDIEHMAPRLEIIE